MNLKELARHYKTSELLELVKSKQYQDQYENIKYYPEEKIRKEIARQGYFPEEYLNDSSMDVRLVVLEEHEEYVPQLMATRKAWDSVLITTYFKHHKNPNVEHLKAFQHRICRKHMREAYKLKIASNTQSTMLEQTMSRNQLYILGNPLWAKGYTIQQIECVLEYLTRLEVDTSEQELIDTAFLEADNYYAN